MKNTQNDIVIKKSPYQVAKNHILMVAAACESGEGAFYGTGFVVDWEGEAYVVTCRHVIDEMEGNILLATPKLKHTLDPKPYGYPCIKLGPPHYHPDDNHEQTYDIAVSKILDHTISDLNAQEITPVQLTVATKGAICKEHGAFTAKGYPVVYAEHAFEKRTEDPLCPQEIHGRAYHICTKESPIKGNGDDLYNKGCFVEADITFENGKGMSGGLVYASNSDKIAGMVVAGGKCNFDSEEEIFGFLFISLERIKEVFMALAC